MRIFRRRRPRPTLRPLDERECYLRLHGVRSGDVAVVQVVKPEASEAMASVGPDGPTEESPALHLVIAYPRNAARLTGEQLRRELLRRMAARSGQAA
ncbi:MAG: hypothetical protein ACRDMY_02505 [Gaiellaceae bacterium]